LLPLLSGTPGSRVVTLSSLSYRWLKSTLMICTQKEATARIKAYGQSKRACLMFAYELQRRLSAAGYGTLSLAAHPGLSKTNLDRIFRP
jgi:NAD(P)-dependent dehydrogenase (short-subunit alcohol dehydrogenase family)